MSDHALEAARTRQAEHAGAERWLGTAWRQFRIERKMFWRNPSAAFFNFLLPLLLLALFGAIFAGERAKLDVIVPGIAGMSVMSATFIALAYNVTLLRERGILKRLRGTPLPTSAWLAGVAANAVANTVLQLGLVILAGRFVFGVAWPSDWIALTVFVALGVVCFAALGVGLSGLVRSAEGSSAVVNLIVLPMAFLTGAFGPTGHYPQVLRAIGDVLPLKYLVDLMNAVYLHKEAIWSKPGAIAVLVAWGVAGLALAAFKFRWEPVAS